jgi:hypothetical protein
VPLATNEPSTATGWRGRSTVDALAAAINCRLSTIGSSHNIRCWRRFSIPMRRITGRMSRGNHRPAQTLLIDPPPCVQSRLGATRCGADRAPRSGREGFRLTDRLAATGYGTADGAGNRSERERQSPFLPPPEITESETTERAPPTARHASSSLFAPIEARPPALRSRCGRTVYQYESTSVNTHFVNECDNSHRCRADDTGAVAQATDLGALVSRSRAPRAAT